MRTLRARLIFAGLFVTNLLRGQSELMVQYKNQLYPVVSAQANSAVALVEGKRVTVAQGDFALRAAPGFQPGFVQIDSWDTYGMSKGKSSASYNYTLVFRGEFSSSIPLKDCFLVAHLKLENNEEGIALCALPNLVPGQKQWVDVQFPLTHPLGRGSYRLHLFSGTGELLHSRMSPDQAPDRKVRPLKLVVPHFPEELKGQAAGGEAVILCRISDSGQVLDASVREATQEPFGREALAAVRQWTFAPAIRDQHYVETSILIPVEFKPPAKDEGARRN
jgi:TonB family protein